jgi:hypothetical protein
MSQHLFAEYDIRTLEYRNSGIDSKGTGTGKMFIFNMYEQQKIV